MSNAKIIVSLQKQNDGIYSSLVKRNIDFERVNIPEEVDEKTHLDLLREENTKLKEVLNANKPPPQPKEKKQPQQQQQKEKKISNNEEDNKKEVEKPKKKNYQTITNMEELKRAFFTEDYETFESQVKTNPFKFYKVGYKYNSDKDGAPDFSARNLQKGFVQNLYEDNKYFMICFRCWKSQTDTKYKYESFWIVNTNEPLTNIIGDLAEDFDFVETTNIDEFIKQIKKLPNVDADEPVYTDGYTCILESYVH